MGISVVLYSLLSAVKVGEHLQENFSILHDAVAAT